MISMGELKEGDICEIIEGSRIYKMEPGGVVKNIYVFPEEIGQLVTVHRIGPMLHLKYIVRFLKDGRIRGWYTEKQLRKISFFEKVLLTLKHEVNKIRKAGLRALHTIRSVFRGKRH